MNILNEFIENSDNEFIKSSKSTILWFYKTNYNLMSKDEREDFAQDIILIVLNALKRYDFTKAKFGTYLTWTFKSYKNDMITKFTGIKVTEEEFYKMRKRGIYSLSVVNLENLKGGLQNDN